VKQATFREIPAKVTVMVCTMHMQVVGRDGQTIQLAPGDFLVERADGTQFGIEFGDFCLSYRAASSAGRDMIAHAALLKNADEGAGP